MFALLDLFFWDFFGTPDWFFIRSPDNFVDWVVSLSSQFLIVCKVDDLSSAGDRFDMFLTKFSQKSINIILKLVSLDLNHATAYRYIFGYFFALVFDWFFLWFWYILLFFFWLFLFPFVFHLHMIVVSRFIGEELGTLLATSKVWLFFLLFCSVFLLTHNDLNF